MSATFKGPRTDGRRARTEAGRARVAAALFRLVSRHGELPPVDAVARAARVSRRSVFRYFDGASALEVQTAQLMRDRLTAEVPPPEPRGTREERLRALVRHRVALFERVRPVRLFLERSAPQNAEVARFLDHAKVMLDQSVAALFPRLRGDRLTAMQVVAGWETWAALRGPTGERRSVRASARVLGLMLRRIGPGTRGQRRGRRQP